MPFVSKFSGCLTNCIRTARNYKIHAHVLVLTFLRYSLPDWFEKVKPFIAPIPERGSTSLASHPELGIVVAEIEIPVHASLAEELTMTVHPNVTNLHRASSVESDLLLKLNEAKVVRRRNLLHLVVVHGLTLSDRVVEVKVILFF